MFKNILSRPKPLKSNYEFKMIQPFEKRQQESQRVLEKYPDFIPIILEKTEHGNLPDLNKKKYLIPKDFTIKDFMITIRKKMQINEQQSIFLFVDNRVLPSLTKRLDEIYNSYKDKDGFLYITYSPENTFG